MAKIVADLVEVLVETIESYSSEIRVTKITHGNENFESDIKQGFGTGLWTWREACECIQALAVGRCSSDVLNDPHYIIITPENPADLESSMAVLNLNDKPVIGEKLLKLSAAWTNSVIFQNMSSKDRQMFLRKEGIIIPIHAENTDWAKDRVSIIRWKFDDPNAEWRYMFEYRV